jgi:hypothetical protein
MLKWLRPKGAAPKSPQTDETSSTEGWNPYSKKLSRAYDAGQDPLQVIMEMMESGGIDHEKQRLGLRPEGFFQIFLAVSDLLLRDGMSKELRGNLLDVRHRLAESVREMGDDLKEGVNVALAAHRQQLRETNGVEQLTVEIEESLTRAMAENLQRIEELANGDPRLAKAEREYDYREIIFCCSAACKGCMTGVDEYFKEYEDIIANGEMLKRTDTLTRWMQIQKLRQKLQIATYWDYRLSMSLVPEGETRQEGKVALAGLLRPDLLLAF